MTDTPTNLIDTVNGFREETLDKHYRAALAELDEKVRNEPLRTVFNIRAGCISKEVTNEIVRRFNAGGSNAVYNYGGVFRTYHYLTVTLPLPPHLVKEEVKEPEETKEETVTEATVEEKPAVADC